MATYDIAPATTGSEIGMAQMRYGLHNKADYNAANLYTAGPTSMTTLVASAVTYQSDLSSKTWNSATPYGFNEMAGQTWQDVAPFNLFIYATPQTTGNCSAFTAVVKKNGTTVSTITKVSGQNPTISTNTISVVNTDIIRMEVSLSNISGAGCISQYSETTVNLQTGNSPFAFITRASVTGTSVSQFYQFTASTSENYINFAHFPVA